MSYEQLKLENQLCFPLYAVSRLITRAYQHDLDRLGITYPQYLVCMLLWEHEEMSVNEIAEKLLLNTNTVTPLLKRMEADLWITRQQAYTDQRKVRIRLTDKGRDIQDLAAEIPLNLLRRLNMTMTDQDLKTVLELKNTLYTLIHTLEGIGVQ